MSPTTNLADLSASELVSLYRGKDASPREAVDAVLARIERMEPTHNAFSFRDPEAARAQAAVSEARWLRGEPAGLLDGVPSTAKDIILTRGWPTLRGSRTVERNQPWLEDAPIVARMREHGAVFLGKTTTPEFGWKGVCDSPLTGTTRNPWNRERTPGGSSGGAAVAAALGMGAVHIGTDGGGSIRIPCGFTGVFGIKPTFGLVPAYPLSPFGTVAHLGPITRTVADAARMLTVISEPDHRDWQSLPYAGRDFSVGLDDGVRRLRVALSLTLGYVKVDPEIRDLVARAASVLADLGAIVEEVDPGFEDPATMFEAHWHSGAANLRRSIPREKWPLIDPGLNRLADEGEAIPHMDYLEAINQRGALGAQMATFHQKYDVLLTPTLPITAFEVNRVTPPGMDQRTWVPWTPFSYPFNLTQQPAASVPCGLTSGGLPAGMQIVAAKNRDDLVLRVARAYESACAPPRFPIPHS